MRLTRSERRQLALLADDLARDNPRLAQALTGQCYDEPRPTGGGSGHRRERLILWIAIAIMAVAIPLVIVGILLDQPVLIALAGTAMFNAPALPYTVYVWRRRGRPATAPTSTRRPREGRTT